MSEISKKNRITKNEIMNFYKSDPPFLVVLGYDKNLWNFHHLERVKVTWI